jgi:hypothetical protein
LFVWLTYGLDRLDIDAERWFHAAWLFLPRIAIGHLRVWRDWASPNDCGLSLWASKSALSFIVSIRLGERKISSHSPLFD